MNDSFILICALIISVLAAYSIGWGFGYDCATEEIQNDAITRGYMIEIEDNRIWREDFFKEIDRIEREHSGRK